ncbi:hypothetical protein JCM16303_002696 [Sporobolomyces ruberrimus]
MAEDASTEDVGPEERDSLTETRSSEVGSGNGSNEAAMVAEGQEALSEVIETRQEEEEAVTMIGSEVIEPTPIAPSVSQADGTVPDEGLPTEEEEMVPARPASPEPEDLAVPPAAQPRRASTPRPRSKSPALPPSSTSSSTTITGLPLPSRSQPSQPNPYQDEDEDSDDPLQMMALDSSATRSTSGAVSRPPKSRVESSPTRNYLSGGEHEEEARKGLSKNGHSRERSQTPTQMDDAHSSDHRDTASASSQGWSRQSATQQGDEETSDDDMDLLGSSQVPTIVTKRGGRRRASFVCVEVPPASRASSGSTPGAPAIQPTSSARSPPPPPTAQPRPSRGLSEDLDDDVLEGVNKRRKTEHMSHADEEKHRSPTPSRPSSPPPASSPRSPQSTSQAQPELPNPELEPLSEVTSNAGLLEEDQPPQSSPLSSVPASTPARHLLRPVPSPPTTSASKRQLSSPVPENDSTQPDSLAAPSTATDESPQKKARVPKVSMKQSNPAPVQAPPKTSTARRPGRPRKVAKEFFMAPEAEKEGEEEAPVPSPVMFSNNGRAVRATRIKAVKKNLREEPSDDDEDEGSEEGEEEDSDSASETVYSSPAKKRRTAGTGKAKASPRVSATTKAKKSVAAKPKSKPEGKAKGNVKGNGNGKGKGKGKARALSDDEDANPEPTSSPSKPSFRATSSFLHDLSQPVGSAAAQRESREERARNWDVREFDDFVWIHVEENDGKGGFWWLGKITNKLRSERPLAIELYVDEKRLVLEHAPSPIVSVEEPSPDNLLQFRSRFAPSKLRFTKDTFCDPSAPPDSRNKLAGAFEDVLRRVLQLESSFGEDSDSEGSDALPDPSQLGASQRSKKSSQKKRELSSESEDLPKSTKPTETDSEDDLLKEQDEVTSFPFYCLAKDKRGWWAATCVGYAEATIAAKGRNANNGPKRKFKIEYPSGESSVLARSSLLFSRQKQFSLVKLQETAVEYRPQYLPNAVDYIKNQLCPGDLQRTLDEKYPPGQSRNDLFYAGGQKRKSLASTSVFGELPSNFVEAFSDAVQGWLLPKEGTRPKGSPRYEALSELDRISYVADVLLPVAIILNYIDDVAQEKETLEMRARKAFEVDGNTDPSQDELDEAIYNLAYQELNTRSATKAIKSMREGRKTAQGQQKANQ